jgi:hypothetical protein
MDIPTIKIPNNHVEENNKYFTPPNTTSNLHHQIIVQGHYLGCTKKCRGCHRCLKNKNNLL